MARKPNWTQATAHVEPGKWIDFTNNARFANRPEGRFLHRQGDGEKPPIACLCMNFPSGCSNAQSGEWHERKNLLNVKHGVVRAAVMHSVGCKVQWRLTCRAKG